MRQMVWIVVCVGLLVACGDDESGIGDHCGSNVDCPDKCQTGGGFPDGICTRQCDDDGECPDGWRCVTKSSGICLRECAESAECRSRYGDRWVCDDEALQSDEGDARVCIGE